MSLAWKDESEPHIRAYSRTLHWKYHVLAEFQVEADMPLKATFSSDWFDKIIFGVVTKGKTLQVYEVYYKHYITFPYIEEVIHLNFTLEFCRIDATACLEFPNQLANFVDAKDMVVYEGH